MGKTYMSVCAIGTRMRAGRVKMVLIVAPVSVLSGWVEEGRKFLPHFVKKATIMKVHGGNANDRRKQVRNAWKQASLETPYVIVTSWGLACSAKTLSAYLPPSGHQWDYVILDEAHEIKNHKSNRSKCCFKLCKKPGTNRLALTGTPFQNDTTELWSIVNMATAGNVFGKLKEFNKEYGKKIKDARCRSASSFAQKEGAQANQALQKALQPYLLRRRKMDFLKDELPKKLEVCVWIKPSKTQKVQYKKLVEDNGFLAGNILSEDKDVANKAKMGAFQVIAQLRNLCGHPLRLRQGGEIRSALEQHSVSSILSGSRKLELTIHMLKEFQKDGKKTLVFSQSTQTLDVIQHVLKKQDRIKYARLDGSVSEKRRQDTVELFQEGKFDVLLLSTGAGGVGLTLTRASRVILFDPDWNPSKDAQAVDRAYRIGQTQEVRVYRLFLAGSIEEKMYEKQIHKNGMETTIFTEGSKPEERYFDKHELCKVFAQVPDGNCELLKRFEREGVGKVLDPMRHMLVSKHASVVGISNHSNIYNGHKRKSAFADAPQAAICNKAKKRLLEEDEQTLLDGTGEEGQADMDMEEAAPAGFASVVSDGEVSNEQNAVEAGSAGDTSSSEETDEAETNTIEEATEHQANSSETKEFGMENEKLCPAMLAS